VGSSRCVARMFPSATWAVRSEIQRVFVVCWDAKAVIPGISQMLVADKVEVSESGEIRCGRDESGDATLCEAIFPSAA
jgi:hypothetical protein